MLQIRRARSLLIETRSRRRGLQLGHHAILRYRHCYLRGRCGSVFKLDTQHFAWARRAVDGTIYSVFRYSIISMRSSSESLRPITPLPLGPSLISSPVLNFLGIWVQNSGPLLSGGVLTP